MHKRVLVYIQRESDCIPQLVSFAQSIVDMLNGGTDHTTNVLIRMQEDKLVISQNKLPSSGNLAENRKLSLTRPEFCPFHCITPSITDQIPSEVLKRGIDVGCAVLVESFDGLVLLIRRALHMRIFPGVWSVPGGHVEENETLTAAGLRELLEETGLDVKTDDLRDGTLSTLGLWESTYPPMLSLGIPQRHHVVLYLHASLKQPHTAYNLQAKLKLDPVEVCSSVWISRQMASAIAASRDGQDAPEDAGEISSESLPEFINITNVNSDGCQHEEMMNSKIFLNFAANGTVKDKERVSTGTKFALEKWLPFKKIIVQLLGIKYHLGNNMYLYHMGLEFLKFDIK